MHPHRSPLPRRHRTTLLLITWNAPAAITYGAALSSTQLNATADVPGAFVYSPAAGTVLKAGTQTLSVVFTANRHKDLFFGHGNGTAFGDAGHS